MKANAIKKMAHYLLDSKITLELDDEALISVLKERKK